MTHLYMYGGNKIFDTDFLEALSRLGVVSGDTIFVHSDMTVFGKPELRDPNTLLSALVEIFKQSVGPEGTVIMPTFTYSFGEREPFDREHSKSMVGSLTEFFRRQPDVARTLHPMHSVAVWGKGAPDVLHIGKDTFGEHTVFAHLRAVKGKIILFGVDLNACTFLHHVEQMHAVPYRFMKTFRGTIVDQGSSYEDTCTYFARELGGADNDMERIGSPLRERGVLREARIGGGVISVAEAPALFEEGMRYLDTDPYGLVQQTA